LRRIARQLQTEDAIAVSKTIALTRHKSAAALTSDAYDLRDTIFGAGVKEPVFSPPTSGPAGQPIRIHAEDKHEPGNRLPREDMQSSTVQLSEIHEGLCRTQMREISIGCLVKITR
jgi:hypothetical protein